MRGGGPPSPLTHPTPKQRQIFLKANFSPSHLVKSTHRKKKIPPPPAALIKHDFTPKHHLHPPPWLRDCCSSPILYKISNREVPDAQNVPVNASPSGLSPQCGSGVITLAGVCGSAGQTWSIPDQTWLLSSCQGFLSPRYALPQLARSPSISPLDALLPYL